ncbi:TPA: NADH-quinone oxidoreductase subunit H, partial [Candidatus Bathyarchaeota archaeon]|nr:NADH-quinone oxidoreductase subunit H [Candidatus Bathyarchaeota archaeon]
FKETVKPETASQLWFVLSPYAGLILAIGATYFVPIGGLSPFGDSPFSLVIVLYLLIGIALMWVIGAAASSSPWGAIGARREAELMLGFEITTIASIFSVAILARSLSISAIVDAQRRLGLPFLVINPLAALGMIMGTIARLRLKPFDIPDAEVEIVAGPFTEYSGKLLAVIQSTRLLLTSVSVALFVDAFLGGGVLASSTPVLDVAINTAAFIVLCIVTTFMIAAVHTLMPRFRIDQGFLWTLKFAWPLAFSGLALSILLACLGVGC